MPPVRRPLAGIAALGAAALIAGCGGGSDSSSADDFRQEADEICADANSRLDTLTEPTSGAAVLPFLQEGLTIQADELERIRARDRRPLLRPVAAARVAPAPAPHAALGGRAGVPRANRTHPGARPAG